MLQPPAVDAEVVRGHLAHFSVSNLDGDRSRFTVGEISQEIFTYLFGMDCATPDALDPAEVAAAQLKIWGVYRGGTNAAAIRKRHRLSEDQFDRIVKKRIAGMLLEVGDDGALSWRN